ncbi:MAG: glycine--tRNA ligase subunit beta [Caldilineales bacterium]
MRMEYPFLEEEGQGAEGQEAEGQASEVAVVAEADLLLEIGCEELPVDDVVSGIGQLGRLAEQLLAEARLDYADLRVTGTPRRLVLHVSKLAGAQTDDELVFRGPPASRAFDADGQPTPAGIGFARSRGVSPAQLEVRDADGGTYVFAVQRVTGKPALEILPGLLVRLISGLRFEKTMRWASGGVAFSRPLRWYVALLGDRVVPFSYANARSGRVSRGLRSQDSPVIEVPDAATYFAVMAQNGIVVDREERRRLVLEQVTALAASVGGQIRDEPALLDEVTDLVEQPAAILGRFESRFLDLPADVLTTVMKKHQRYFPVVGGSVDRETGTLVDRESGKLGNQSTNLPIYQSTNLPTYQPTNLPAHQSTNLLPYFITVANGEPRDAAVVRAGNEGVIRARYSDAAFFVEHDRQHPLGAFTSRLATLTFQEQLGSMLDKVQRLEKLAPALAEQLDLSAADRAIVVRAAALCKSDLATSMVIEMTSLQGIMGREYALDSGESPAVAQAIFEHYLPRYSGDRRPETLPGLVVGLANRLDSIAGLFAVGLEPSGSADPFGLRRDALGIVQNLAGAGISFSVRWGWSKPPLLPAPADAQVVARRSFRRRPAGELAARRRLSLRRGAGRAGRAGRRSGRGPSHRGRSGRGGGCAGLVCRADRLRAASASSAACRRRIR